MKLPEAFNANHTPLLSALLLILATGCGSRSEKVGGETNWLKVCTTDSQCVNSDCLCGVCTRTCDVAEDCRGVGNAICVALDDDRAQDRCDNQPTLGNALAVCLPPEPAHDASSMPAANASGATTSEATSNQTTQNTSEPTLTPDAGGKTSEPTLAPDAGVSKDGSSLPDLLLEGPAFDGTLTLHSNCPDEFAQEGVALPVQFIFEQNDESVWGYGWGLPAWGQATLAVDPISAEIVGSDLDMGQTMVPSFRFRDVTAEGATIKATLPITPIDFIVGDIISRCDATGELELTRDITPPSLESAPTTIAGFQPISLLFSEPVRTAALDVLVDGVRYQYNPGSDFTSSLEITREAAWQSGSLTVALGFTDAGGIRAEDATLVVDVPTYTSLTTNPSLELELGDEPLWFGECTVESPLDPGFGGMSGPSEGNNYLVCPGTGQLLQVYVEPPPGATVVHFDLADYNVTDSPPDPARIELDLRYPDQTVPAALAPEDLAPDHPGLRTYSAPLERDDPFWLVVDYQSEIHDEGDPRPTGMILADNLRFDVP